MGNEANKYRMIWTEDVKVCACCGRDELKGTYKVSMPGGSQYFGQVCARKQGYTKEEIKIAKSKANKEYDQIGFVNDPRVAEINEEITNTRAYEKATIAKLTKKLISIREEYKIN